MTSTKIKSIRWQKRPYGLCQLSFLLLLVVVSVLQTAISSEALRFSVSGTILAFSRRLHPKIKIGGILRDRNIFVRGGAGGSSSGESDSKKSNDSDEKLRDASQMPEETEKSDSTELPEESKAIGIKEQEQPKHRKRSRIRHTSDMLYDLIERSAVSMAESVKLRQRITQRSKEYAQDLSTRRKEDPLKKLPHPKKVLHFLAPKIPAIKHSPDVTLQIQTARSDIDSGVAACLIGTLAHICEVYDNELLIQTREKEEESGKGGVDSRPASSSLDIVKDRRFEQVVECLLCGVDVQKRKREYMTHYLDAKNPNDESSRGSGSNDVDDILEGEEVQVREGLYIRDACRASWGLAILGAHHCGSLGGTKVIDLLRALSLRIRESLLSRLQLLRQGDLMEDLRVLDENFAKLSPEDRLYELSEELAEDAATAMWTFACVRACTGMRSAQLFETCCSILCQNPFEIRKQAQEAESLSEQSTSEIGVHDVVDRLARVEDEVEDQELESASTNITTKTGSKESKPQDESTIDPKKETTNIDKKELLIDWLSPNELTDVLWSLALHGHSDKNDAREEIILSETAGVLKEVAFDRLMALLREDYAFLESVKRNGDAEDDEQMNSSTTEYVTNEGETMTVEVVDAAALLASENAAKTAVVSSVENMTKRSTSGGLVSLDEDIEIVDAATILQSSSERIQQEVLTAEQEVLVDEKGEQITRMEKVLTDEDTFVESSTGDALNSMDEEMEATQEDPASHPIHEQMYFSAHDLCALAWAVTELRDSLRFQIVDLVINIFAGLGEDSVDRMTGSDLANLAWAIARHSLDARPWSSSAVNHNSLSLTIWIVKRALITSGGHLGGHEPLSNVHILDSFQPPELSRLMWAVASTIRAHTDKEAEYLPAVDQLAINALVATASNLSTFSAEDMVRILWAFLELCDLDDALTQPGVATSIGRILASVETSILRWERGRSSIKPEEADASNKEAARFTSLFLRPKLSRKLLDQIIEEYNDLEEEEEKVLSTFAEEKRSKLPRLRDLGIDPATLCKAAGALAKLAASNSDMRGSGTLTRVTLKLLTSKSGRLLKEFSMADLIRACEAAAINDAVGRGEDVVVGQFARRYIQLLNEASNTENETWDSHLKLSSASPKEVATLLWSLGELGARHSVSDKERSTAYRRLRLVHENPLLTNEQILSLSTDPALKALRGLVALNVMRSDKAILIKMLQLIEPKIASVRREANLCDLAESIATIRQSLDREDFYKKETEGFNSTNTIKQETNHTRHDTNATEEPLLDAKQNSTEPTAANSTVIPASDFDLLQGYCERMLTTLAVQATERVSDLKAGSLRRLLTVYSLLPFQADGLIDAFENEVLKRQDLLESAASTGSVEELLNKASENALSANKTVFGKADEEGNSAMAALRSGLKSIFAPADDDEDEEQSEEMKAFTEKVGALLNQVTASVTDVDKCMDQIGSASNIHTDTALQRVMDGTNFELGRCQELIDNYRRIEFSTGLRRSRYDYERSRDIGKRLLSRLIPR